MSSIARTVTIALWLVSAPLAAAADEAAKPEKRWKNVADIGFVDTSGNTDTTSLNIGEKLTWTPDKWKVEALFGLVWAEQDGVETANQWRAGIRADRDLSKRLAVYGLVGWERDPYAGYDGRFTEGVGLAYKAVDAPRDLLVLDGGFSLVQEEFSDGTSNDYPAGRLGGLYKHSFAEKAYFQQTLVFIPSLEDSEDYLINSETALVAPVWGPLALKVAYLIKYDHLPAAGFEDTDTTLTAGLQISF